jgi:uncharacterized protein (DUF1499 family)
MDPTPATGKSPLSRWGTRVVLLSLITVVLALAGVVLPALFYRGGIYGLDDVITMVKVGARGGIVATVLAVIGLVLLLPAKRPKYLTLGALLAIILGASAWIIPHTWLGKLGSLPPIHDISTDTNNPPQFQTQVLALRKAAQNSTAYGGAEIAAQQAGAYPDIQPILLKLPATMVYAASLRTLQNMGLKLDSNDPVAGIIEATSTSTWLGLRYDMVIRLEAHGRSATRLDIRSESRTGKNDAGKNAQLIRTFKAALYKQLGLQSLRQH